MRKCIAVIFLAVGLCGCKATTGTYRPLNGGAGSRPADCQVSVFHGPLLSESYVAVSRLNVHLEKTFFMPSDFASARDELNRQACRSGADAVIDIQEQSSRHLETRIYNLSGTGVRFLGGAAAQ